MNGERRWLPRTALEAREIAEAVAPCLAEWSAAWLAGGTLVPLGTWQECGGDPVWPATRRDCGAGIALRIDPGGLRALAAAMIGRRLEEHDLRTPSDRAVIDHLLARALDDLAQRLARFATGLTASEDGSVHVLPIGMGGEELFLIEADRSVLVALALTLAGAQRKGASLVNRS